MGLLITDVTPKQLKLFQPPRISESKAILISELVFEGFKLTPHLSFE